ncbi:MAG TPA: TonB-dependent receptor [Acidobacteriaceae bacterium]|nr:TonB-dependent receptor [Acidobacteriaceae bacterium]
MSIAIRRLRAAAICSALVLATCGAFAQNTNSGDIRGIVTDSSGAAIPDTAVEVKDVDKNVIKTYTTNSAGFYDTGSITPDHYVLTFSKGGFGTLTRGPISLDVSTVTVDAGLKVGVTAQNIVVTTDIPLLSTESGAQEDTLKGSTISELPQTGADWENFVVFLPGAAGAPENANNAPNPGQVASVNGNLPYASILADGATTTLPQSQNSDVAVLETVSEVKVSSSAFSAQYGIGGIVYNQITKGGTNQFHGAAYEYFQNDALNASPYEFGATNASIPLLRYNNFGFSVGGPILKNKLFFFFDFDKTISRTGGTTFSTVPTQAVLNGDFSGPGFPTIYDPFTQTIQQTGSHVYNGSSTPTQCPCVIRTSFADEYGQGNKIPAALIDPVAKRIQSYFPAPNNASQVNASGVQTNNLFTNIPNTNPFNKYFGRLDYDITGTQRLTVSETSSDNPGFNQGIGICPIGCESQDVSRDNAQVSHVWTISPTLINEARFGFTDQLNFFVPATLNQNYPATVGLQFARANLFPNVNINNYFGLSSSGNTLPFNYKEFVFDPSDVFTLTRGRHVLHFGGEYLINRVDSTPYGYINAGSVGYTGTYTAEGGGNTTSRNGVAYADFLLGETNNYQANVQPEYGGRLKNPQLFVQDDWKLRTNLTVNLGLRWEGLSGWSEVKGNIATFDPQVVNPANGSLGAIYYGFNPVNGRHSLQAPLHNIVLPRVGFSYQPKNNTVIRGGFGFYTSTFSIDTYGSGIGSAFGSSANYGDTSNGICPVTRLSSDGNTPADPRIPSCASGIYNPTSVNANYLTAPTTPDAFNGQSVGYNAYHTPPLTSYQYNVAVQRQFGADFVAEVAFVGNHSKNLNTSGVDINQVPEALLGPNDLNSRPYPLFNNIAGSFNNGISNYNSLQVQASKRASHGIEFNVNYVWSKFLDDQDSSGFGSRGGYQNYQNALDTNANYSNSNFDIRNAFKGQAIYRLPFGEQRAFLNNSRLLDEVVGGWQVSSTFIVQSGNPIGITTGNNNSSNNQSGGYTQFANLVGNYKLPGGVKSRLNEYYNLDAFAVPAPYTYGNFRRNVVVGPGLSEVNASLGKTFAVYPERGVNLAIRCDAVNVLNHPSFGQPGNNAIGNGESAQISSTTVGGRGLQLYARVSF